MLKKIKESFSEADSMERIISSSGADMSNFVQLILEIKSGAHQIVIAALGLC